MLLVQTRTYPGRREIRLIPNSSLLVIHEITVYREINGITSFFESVRVYLL